MKGIMIAITGILTISHLFGGLVLTSTRVMGSLAGIEIPESMTEAVNAANDYLLDAIQWGVLWYLVHRLPDND